MGFFFVSPGGFFLLIRSFILFVSVSLDGLHYGWAIEGAIGSSMKIDASYLSPHVNTAARLEAASKQFQTMILMSGDFVKR